VNPSITSGSVLAYLFRKVTLFISDKKVTSVEFFSSILERVLIKGGNGLKDKLLFTILALTLFLAACSDVEVTGKDKLVKPSIPEFIFNNDEFPPTIPGYIKVGETQYEMAKGNYKWKNGNTHAQTDAASPTQIAKNFKPIILEPNTKVSIEIEQNPNLSAYFWNYEGKVDLQDGQITVPASKGRYIYEVLAIWSNGDVSYTFVVEIK
jgi:hypothetical protein